MDNCNNVCKQKFSVYASVVFYIDHIPQVEYNIIKRAGEKTINVKAWDFGTA